MGQERAGGGHGTAVARSASESLRQERSEAAPDAAAPDAAARDAAAPDAADPLRALRRQATRALGHIARPRSYVGVAREVALAAVHVGTYPLGVLPGVRPSNPPSPGAADEAGHDTPADEQAAATPVILVHGYVHNRSAFLVMSQALRRAGFRHVRGINYNPLTQDMATIAACLAGEVEDVLASTGATICKIVGHSMGGIVARHYVQLLGGDEHVDTVITLGAPHRGSYTSYVGPGPAAAQLKPGSTYLRHLEETARPSRVRWIALYSDLDLMVLPAVHAKLVHPALGAENVRVRDTGHLSLLMSREVIKSVTDHLSAPRPAAGTEATGAEAAETQAAATGARPA